MKKFAFRDPRIPKSVLFKSFLCLLVVSLTASLLSIHVKAAVNPKLKITSSKAVITVSGKITDSNNETLPGVSIKEKGTQNGVVSTNNGDFSINVSSENSVLVFSYIGFETQEISVGKNTKLNVVLKSESKLLNDVVVIGYGSVKKGDVTGSVSSIKAADFKNTQLTSVSQALQGRAAGVQVTNSDATPGARPNIRIRGNNSLGTSSEPLFVVDGYPSNEDLSSLNPNDIESMEILKDASATAIYGSRGANGVILITTKRGKAGQLNINLEGYHGVSSVTKKLDLMNAREYAEYKNEVIKNLTPTAAPFASQALLDYFSTHTTNWQDELFQSAPVSSAQLSISGGEEKTKFLLSGEVFQQDGIVRKTGFERGNLRFNLDRQISDKLKFGLTSVLAHTLGHNTLVNTAGGTQGGVILNALRINPSIPVSGPINGYSYGNGIIRDDFSVSYSGNVDRLGNPVAYSERVTNDAYLNRAQVSMFGEYDILKGLKLKVLVGGESASGRQNFFAPSDLYEEAGNKGSGSKFNRITRNWLNENYLTYTKDFGSKYSITALAGVSFQKFNNETSTASSAGIFSNAFEENSLGAGPAQKAFSFADQNQLQSYYTRINGKLWSNLLLTATLRADGSSKFGANHRYGYFPSAAIAYKLKELPMLKKLDMISDLKIRAGYGVTGNQEINPYLSRYGYDLASSSNNPSAKDGNVVFGTTKQVAAAASQVSNQNLQWEQTAAFNAGVDVSLWSERLLFTIDYYNKKTTNLLWQVALPATTGFTNAQENLGSISNKGLELSLSGKPISTTNFKWNSSFNLATNRNKILSLGLEPFRKIGSGEFEALISREDFIILQPGQELGKFFLYTFDGIWQSQTEINNSNFSNAYKATLKPGFAKYIDINNDQKIDQGDKKIMDGSAYPKFVFGFTNTFSYKGFELNAFLQGQQGNKILNLNKYYLEYEAANNKGKSVLNRWKGEGTSNTLTAAGSETSRLLADDFLEDGSYIRLKSLSLSYQINDNKWLKGAKINSLRLYVTGTNLGVITKYTGFDPEVNSYASTRQFVQGVDQGAYAVARSFIFGAKFGF
ncbi:SusC/RagA family TonB-linked outer membrane protein [Pedobacter lithocola]|uniref:SusC/RagA family TonB-linked outer membrane protein n=1 Tax=Pedobacter lithocola TaxID=1908239 RepID=A0ABV8PHX1_9SPHI